MQGDIRHRQMELNPRVADGEMHSPEQVRRQMEEARQRAEYYAAQQQALEQSNEQKALFTEGLNTIGMRLHNAVTRLEREMQSMDREYQEVRRVYECLNSHLQILSAMQPQNWSTEGFANRLNEAIIKLERAENDFNEAYIGAKRFHHTQVFLNKPGVEEKEGLNWKKVGEHLLNGLAFHLPLFLLILISWTIYICFIAA